VRLVHAVRGPLYLPVVEARQPLQARQQRRRLGAGQQAAVAVNVPEHEEQVFRERAVVHRHQRDLHELGPHEHPD
jgi:hypothetical protein